MRKTAAGLALVAWLLPRFGLVHNAAARNAGQSGTIVAFGDSLTAGYGVVPEEAYPARLEKKLHAAGYMWKVINAGIKGETSSGAFMRAKTILELKPDIVILETGANDDMRGVDPRTTTRNIERIVRILQDNRSTVVLAGMRSLNGQRPNPAFADIYPAIARKYRLILIPFFLEHVAGEPALTLDDGIHPTADGYRIITNMVYPYVQKAIDAKTKARLVK